LKEILQEFVLINSESIQLLEESPDPAFHAQYMIDNGMFTFGAVVDNPLIFIITFLVNWAGFAGLVDIVASFYQGYEPVDLKAMGDLF
jgi:hypothetical protein